MTELFSDGFESGNFNAWTGHNGGTVQNTTKYAGTYAAKFTGGDSCYKTFTSGSKIYYRAYINWVVLPDGSGKVIMCGFYSGAARWTLYYENSSGTLQFRLRNNLGSYDIGTYAVTLETGHWYCCEVLWENAVQLRFYLDGTERIGATMSDSSNINQIYILVSTYTNCEIYFDCVVVADAYIGVEGAPPIGQQLFCLINEMGY